MKKGSKIMWHNNGATTHTYFWFDNTHYCLTFESCLKYLALYIVSNILWSFYSILSGLTYLLWLVFKNTFYKSVGGAVFIYMILNSANTWYTQRYTHDKVHFSSKNKLFGKAVSTYNWKHFIPNSFRTNTFYGILGLLYC